ncbi:replication factor A [Halocatena halophila]|uniref:replication factor A n=1 Tax=Halocatena halophila TaxID=2814576 RepID=UPI002ED055C3
MEDLTQQAKSVHAQFDEHLDLDVDAIESRLETLVSKYRIPPEEAQRSLIENYREEADLNHDDLDPRSNNHVDVATIDEDEQWIDVRVKVVELWEPRSDAIAQVGLLGDESGRIKFVSFATSDLAELEEDSVYELSNVVTDEYEGRYSIKLNRTTSITEIEEDIEPGNDHDDQTGALVDIQRGSGLVKRCPTDDCTRVLQNGRCSEHGEVDGEFDLRIKGVLDDGTTVQEVIFDCEQTEELTDITLDRAKEIARDKLDTGAVLERMEPDIVGRYFEVTGPKFGRYLLVDEFEQLGALSADEALEQLEVTA